MLMGRLSTEAALRVGLVFVVPASLKLLSGVSEAHLSDRTACQSRQRRVGESALSLVNITALGEEYGPKGSSAFYAVFSSRAFFILEISIKEFPYFFHKDNRSGNNSQSGFCWK